MEFTIIKPQYTRSDAVYLGDKVRVSFPIVNNNQLMVMLIGKDVAFKYGFKKGDRVALHISVMNPFLWQLRPDPTGFKLGEQNNQLKLQISWSNQKTPSGYRGLRFVTINQVMGHMQLEFTQLSKEINENEE